MPKVTPSGIIAGLGLCLMALMHDCHGDSGIRGRHLRIGDRPVPISATKSDLHDYIAGDRPEWFSVAPGTSVTVVDPGPAATRVEIKAGPRAGSRGWVASEWVK